MLMTKKRFRYDTRYVYGSAAVIVGFGAIMALLVNLAPMRVPGNNIATVPENAQKTEPNETARTTAQNNAPQNETQAQPSGWSNSMINSVPQTAQNSSVPATTPVITDSPSVPETPVTPAVPTEPVVPVVPETPVIPEDEETQEEETPPSDETSVPVLDPVVELLVPQVSIEL